MFSSIMMLLKLYLIDFCTLSTRLFTVQSILKHTCSRPHPPSLTVWRYIKFPIIHWDRQSKSKMSFLAVNVRLLVID